MDDTIIRIIVEGFSAIACIVLTRFMIKPYQLKKQGKYLGLPLGFAILGLSFVLTIILVIQPQTLLKTELSWLAHFTRVFAFVFLAITYYFSTKTETHRLQWNLSISLTTVVLIALTLILIYAPQETLSHYTVALTLVRLFSIGFLAYVIVHTLRIHNSNPNTTPKWIPLGFFLLALSQVLLLSYALLETSIYTDILKWGGFVVRLAGLVVFLLVTYHAFYGVRGKGINR
jgi:hypothetical protein